MKFKYMATIFCFLSLVLVNSCSLKNDKDIQKQNNEVLDVSSNDLLSEEEIPILEEKKEENDNKFRDDFEMIDYHKILGEKYYFYLTVDNYLLKIIDIIKNDSLFEDFEISEKVFNYIEYVKENDISVDKYEFGASNEYSGSLSGDIVDVPVLVSYSYINDKGEFLNKKAVFLFIVEKISYDEDIYWKIIDIQKSDYYLVE